MSRSISESHLDYEILRVDCIIIIIIIIIIIFYATFETR